MANKEYTEEELNYFRVCYITTHIIREGLKRVHVILRKYILDKYSEEQIAEFILLYVETLSTSAQHDPLHFNLNFNMTSKMMAPHLKTLCHQPFLVWKLVLAKTSERNALPSTFFSFGDICRKRLGGISIKPSK